MKRPTKTEPVAATDAAGEPDHAEILGNALPFAMSEELDKARGYLERGRHLADVDSVTLKDSWVATLGKLPANPLDPELRLALDDTAAELQLRGEELPTERAIAEVEAFVLSIEALVAEGIKADPAAWDRYNLELVQDIRDFILARRQAN